MGAGRLGQPAGGREGARRIAWRHRQDLFARRQCAVRARADALARRAGDRLCDHGRYELAIGRMYRTLPEDHWKADQPEADTIREWAEVNYLPSDGIWKKDAVSPRRYLAIRIRPRQGELLRDGNRLRHFCIVTNRSDPEGGSGLDLIRWHRQKAGTIEHAHDVLMNELAGAALPSQKFGANAAWLRLNVILYN